MQNLFTQIFTLIFVCTIFAIPAQAHDKRQCVCNKPAPSWAGPTYKVYDDLHPNHSNLLETDTTQSQVYWAHTHDFWDDYDACFDYCKGEALDKGTELCDDNHLGPQDGHVFLAWHFLLSSQWGSTYNDHFACNSW